MVHLALDLLHLPERLLLLLPCVLWIRSACRAPEAHCC